MTGCRRCGRRNDSVDALMRMDIDCPDGRVPASAAGTVASASAQPKNSSAPIAGVGLALLSVILAAIACLSAIR